MATSGVCSEAYNLSSSSSGRRSSCSASPEFEFWMVRNPSFPQPNLLSADELFVEGVLRPLHLLPPHHHHHHHPDPTPEPDPEPPNSTPTVTDPEPARPECPPVLITESTAVLSSSKRWIDIFKKSSAKNPEGKEREKEKDKKKAEKERKGGSGASSAELNINIWPFSRSRSAGNAGTRPKSGPGAPGTRKVNSAPCSRSNSAGESKSKKWPSSPGRAGVHLGRSSPVWQVRRGGGSSMKSSETMARGAERAAKKDAPETRRSRTAANSGATGPKATVLNLNVPMCIGYRHHLSCKSDENSAVGGGGGGGNNIRRIISNGGYDGGRSGSVGNGGNLFNLRNLFTKKVY